MAMIAGTVSSVYALDARGNAVFSGTANSMSLSLANARAGAALQAAGFPSTNPIPILGQKTAPYSAAAPATKDLIAQLVVQVRAIYDSIVLFANADAGAHVSYLQAHAVARVTSQQLGRVPSGGAGTPIDAPSGPVDVPVA